MISDAYIECQDMYNSESQDVNLLGEMWEYTSCALALTLHCIAGEMWEYTVEILSPLPLLGPWVKRLDRAVDAAVAHATTLLLAKDETEAEKEAKEEVETEAEKAAEKAADR